MAHLEIQEPSLLLYIRLCSPTLDGTPSTLSQRRSRTQKSELIRMMSHEPFATMSIKSSHPIKLLFFQMYNSIPRHPSMEAHFCQCKFFFLSCISQNLKLLSQNLDLLTQISE